MQKLNLQTIIRGLPDMKKLFNQQQDLEIKLLYLKGETMEKIAQIYDCYKQSIRYSLKRTQTSIRNNWNRAKGEKNGKWKGGRRIIGNYLHLLMPNHPYARKDGYIREHHLVMEKKLGRYLTSKEVVNHIDGNTFNNNPDNLEVFANNGLHIKNHIKNFQRDKSGRFTKLLPLV